jgi:ribosomal protein S18 acetylase RimI-like enzyme
MKTAIRPMVHEDKQPVMRLMEDITQFTPEEVTVAEEVIDCFLQKSPNSGYHVYVADADSSVAGYICYGPTPLIQGTWDIYWLAVDVKIQGQGLGKALMEFAESKIRGSQGRLVIVETSSKLDYEKTRRFYRSRDYNIVSRIADFYAPGDDKLVLAKRLA